MNDENPHKLIWAFVKLKEYGLAKIVRIGVTRC
jgi:hypothetical protein